MPSPFQSPTERAGYNQFVDNGLAKKFGIEKTDDLLDELGHFLPQKLLGKLETAVLANPKLLARFKDLPDDLQYAFLRLQGAGVRDSSGFTDIEKLILMACY